VAAADIGELGTAFELFLHSIESRNLHLRVESVAQINPRFHPQGDVRGGFREQDGLIPTIDCSRRPDS
jgi:hypothetical protein